MNERAGMLSACFLFLLVVMVGTASSQSTEQCRPSCAKILTQVSGVGRWCSGRPGNSNIADSLLLCVGRDGFKDTPGLSDGNTILFATSPSYEDIKSSDTKWIVCQAKADHINVYDESKVFFGAVWSASEEYCPKKYSAWLATFKTPPCWNYDAGDVDSLLAIDNDKAASMLETQTYRCDDCNFFNTEKPTEDSTFSAGQKYSYIITKDERTMVYRYLTCNDKTVDNFPTLKAVSSTKFSCENCKPWVNLNLEGSFDCETGKKEEVTNHNWCKPEPPLTTTQTTPTTPTTQTTQTALSTNYTSELTTTQLSPTTESNGNDRPQVLKEALEQLKTQNFGDDALKNPSNMLMNMDTSITDSNSLEPKEVSEVLQGLERFSKQILLKNNASGDWNVTAKYNNFTLVVASGAVGTLVSDSEDGIKLLKPAEEWTVNGLLEGPAAVGALLSLGPGSPAVGIAVTVFPRHAVNAAFSRPELNVNSDVISVQVETFNSSLSLNYVDIVVEPHFQGVRRRCGMWDLNASTWDFSNCTLFRRGQVTDVCRCWHLTHFAQLVTDADINWGVHAKPLEVMSLAGVGASLLGGLGLGVTAVFASNWRRKPGTRVLLQLGSAVVARDLLLALVTVDAFRPAWLWPAEDPQACRILGVVLQYALLASVAWTTTAAVLQLLKLSTVSGVQAAVPHVVLVSSACSWLSPLIPVVSLLATSGLKAGYPQRQDSATDFLCYPQGVALYATVVGPVALCTAVNAAIFLYLLLAILFPVCQENGIMPIRIHGSTNMKRRVLTAVMLFFLLGLPWLLGPPARLPGLAYLFCLVATPQGMALFVFFVLCNQQLRKSMWTTVSRVVTTTTTPSISRITTYKNSTERTTITQPNDSLSDKASLVCHRQSPHAEELAVALKKRCSSTAKTLESSF